MGGAKRSGRASGGNLEGGAVHCASARPARRTSRVAFRGEAPEPGDPLLDFAPYMHKQPRRNSITPERQRAFIAMLAATGIVTQAARHIGVSLEALYALRNRPGAEGFAAAWEAAVDRGMARLEDCALERAIAGEERVLVRRGEVVARWTRYDTQLLVFLLRNRRRGRFGDGGRGVAAPEPMPDEAAIYASINAKLDKMRERMAAAEAEVVAEAEAEQAAPEQVLAPETPAAPQPAPPDERTALAMEAQQYEHGRQAERAAAAQAEARMQPRPGGHGAGGRGLGGRRTGGRGSGHKRRH